MLLYVYMQRIRPEGSRHEVGGGGQPGGGNAEHWVVHKMLFRWYINKELDEKRTRYVFYRKGQYFLIKDNDEL